ncbi:MAG: amylo-alpha-1,6-glucosidase [Synergistaceae bacterium]|nr:amylo-alpha-1,6-glucosidase [Synergistaceae bacterium]
MYLGKADVNTYEKGAGREYLVSNGRGSYCFSTVAGSNTRREHGLLVVRPQDCAQHRVLVSKVEETLFTRGKKYQLSTNRYKDVIFPDGFRYIQEFHSNPLPSILFVVHSLLMRKTVYMPEGKDACIVKYELLASPDRIQLEVRPLFAHRLYTEVRSKSAEDSFHADFASNGILVNGRQMSSFLSFPKGEWHPKAYWHDHLLYENDEISAPSTEDLWSPGSLSIEMAEGETAYVVFSSEPFHPSVDQIEAFEKDAIANQQSRFGKIEPAGQSSAVRDLTRTALHLFASGKDRGTTLFSGYPSLCERARDTFIALPGLTLSLGRYRDAEEVLNRWLDLARLNDAVMPSEIDTSTGHALLKGADAGLWFLYALEKLTEKTGSLEFAEKNWEILVEMVSRYETGIRALDLHCEEDLLVLEKPDPERHWMEGTVNGSPVVVRCGKLVEFNALWYNALRAMERFAEGLGLPEDAEKYGKQADRTRESFVRTFWNPEGGFLYDSVDGEKKDDVIRPNQILAVSLPSSPLPPEIGRSVVEVCWNELVTTYGLRTLDPHHDKYKGRFEGRSDQKAKARYRGMAWPWLLGQFVTAYMRYNPKRSDIAWCFIRPFTAHLRQGCLGGIAEVFDGSMPYLPHGAVLSAASMGEILRVMEEDLLLQQR